MFDVFVRGWRIKEVRQKMYYVLLIIAVYRIGCHIGVFGINAVDIATMSSAGNDNLFSLITGGNQGTIFAMGIGPYITSSIIMQLLTVAIPKLEAIQKEGEEGRKRINKFTRYLAVVLALVQAIGTVYSFSQSGYFTYNTFWTCAVAVITMVTGTMFIVWLSELLTEKAIGNGSSFIIFSNILSSLPRAALSLYGNILDDPIMGSLKVVVVLAVFFGIIMFVVRVQDGERKIPVQYSKKMVGRQMVGGQSSFIPIKVNIAGVMSIIFAVSLLNFPEQIYNFSTQFGSNPTWLETAAVWLKQTHPFGAVLYVVLIFAFTFFYTSFAINPTEMAENMKKNGGFVPGIRPGKPTADYIQRTVDRLSWIGAVFYSAIAVFPLILEWTGLQSDAGFGGTTLLIVTGVALEIVKQIESQLLMRHHKGFLNK